MITIRQIEQAKTARQWADLLGGRGALVPGMALNAGAAGVLLAFRPFDPVGYQAQQWQAPSFRQSGVLERLDAYVPPQKFAPAQVARRQR